MEIQISPADKKIIIEILQKHFPDAEYLLFGSRIKGTAGHYSDVDIAIRTTEPLPLSQLFLLEEDFAESDLPYKVDIVDWHRISEEFQQHILSNYVTMK